MQHDRWNREAKKKPYALKLRPSTIELLGQASQASQISKNLIVERGTIAEAKKTLKKVEKGIDLSL